MPRTLDQVTAEVVQPEPGADGSGRRSTTDLEFRTVRLDDDRSLMAATGASSTMHNLDLLPLGAASGLLWSRSGRTLVGIGSSRSVAVDQQLLSAIPGRDDVGLPGSGPVAFAALPFDPTSGSGVGLSSMSVPELILAAEPDGRRWATVVEPGASELSDGELVGRVVDRVRVVFGEGAKRRRREPKQLSIQSMLAPEVWRDQIVADARGQIRAGELNKAVLARELRVTADAPFDQVAIVRRLAATFPLANLFLIDGFFGASPETLISRMGDVVTAHPLAGTLPRASDPNRDRELAAQLLASDKNRWEHRITIDWLLDTLLPFCSYVDAEPEPSLMSLANVHHLGTKVEGRLSSPAASVLELVEALHPTPAVGGEPQADALALIAKLEQADRGRYAGPTGWVDAAGNGQFAVSVRSAQFDSADQVTLFAGVGVVGDSELQAELDETRAKFQAILGALLHP